VKRGFATLGLLLAMLLLRASRLDGAPKPATAEPDAYIVGTITIGPSPARAVWVIAFDGNREVARSLTGGDGRYYLGGLGNRTYIVVVRRQLKSPNMFSGSATLPRDWTYNIRL